MLVISSLQIFAFSLSPSNRKSDTDSGAENEPTTDSSIPSGNQVLASSVVKMICPSGRITLDNNKGKSNKKQITDFAKPKKTKRREHNTS